MRSIWSEGLTHLRERLYSLRYYRTGRVAIACCITCGVKYLGRRGVVLPHPVGIVIGRQVEIGHGCRIYQNVTIGAKSDAEATQGIYPRIGNNVIIYAGAVLIGGLRVGDNAVVGAGAIVTHNVPAGVIVAGNPARIISKGSGDLQTQISKSAYS